MEVTTDRVWMIRVGVFIYQLSESRIVQEEQGLWNCSTGSILIWVRSEPPGAAALFLTAVMIEVNKKKDSDLRVLSLEGGASSREARTSLLRVLAGCSSGPVLTGGRGRASEQSPRALCTNCGVRSET